MKLFAGHQIPAKKSTISLYPHSALETNPTWIVIFMVDFYNLHFMLE